MDKINVAVVGCGVIGGEDFALEEEVVEAVAFAGSLRRQHVVAVREIDGP